MELLISPHNDDESLFTAYTIIRHKPLVLVITDSFIQPNRGDLGCDAITRREETIRAMEILGAPVAFLGLRDDVLTERGLIERLNLFARLGFERVYVPAIQGGNQQHDLISKVCEENFRESNLIRYTTYTKTELWTKGNIEIIPTSEEIELKRRALMCYQSQINLASTRPHFQAVLQAGHESEWLI